MTFYTVTKETFNINKYDEFPTSVIVRTRKEAEELVNFFVSELIEEGFIEGDFDNGAEEGNIALTNKEYILWVTFTIKEFN